MCGSVVDDRMYACSEGAGCWSVVEGEGIGL